MLLNPNSFKSLWKRCYLRLSPGLRTRALKVYHLSAFSLNWSSSKESGWKIANCSLQHSICSLLRAQGQCEMLWAPFTPLQVALLCIQSTEVTITWSDSGQQSWAIDAQIVLTGLSLKTLPVLLLWFLWQFSAAGPRAEKFWVRSQLLFPHSLCRGTSWNLV